MRWDLSRRFAVVGPPLRIQRAVNVVRRTWQGSALASVLSAPKWVIRKILAPPRDSAMHMRGMSNPRHARTARFKSSKNGSDPLDEVNCPVLAGVTKINRAGAFDGLKQWGAEWKLSPSHLVSQLRQTRLECPLSLEQNDVAVPLIAIAEPAMSGGRRADLRLPGSEASQWSSQ
jgi:hypothetical protein